jgi:hypothetical protein
MKERLSTGSVELPDDGVDGLPHDGAGDSRGATG